MRQKAWLLASVLLVIVASVPVFAQGPFSDVPPDHWAYAALQRLAEAGVIEGYPDGTFRGGRSMTRYEFAVAIARVMENLEKKIAAVQGAPGPPGLPGEAGPPGPAGALTEEQQALLNRLASEFAPELAQLRSDLNALTRRVEALEARPVVELPKLRVSGGIRYRAGVYGEDFKNHGSNFSGVNATFNVNSYHGSLIDAISSVTVPVDGEGESVTIGAAYKNKDAFKANKFSSMRTRVILDGDINENLTVQAVLQAEPRDNFGSVASLFRDGYGSFDATTPNATLPISKLDVVDVDQAWGKFKTSALGLPFSLKAGKQYWGFGQGLLINNDLAATKSVVAEIAPSGMAKSGIVFTGLIGLVDREEFLGSDVISNSGLIPIGTEQDGYSAARVAGRLGSWEIGGSYLFSGIAAERGWQADLSGKVFGHRIFGEFAKLNKLWDGGSTGSDGKAWIVGADIWDSKWFTLTGKYGQLESNFAPTLSLLNPYAAVSADYIDWADRPLFLDPMNVAKGYEANLLIKDLPLVHMPMAIRYYGGQALGSSEGGPRYLNADQVLVASISKKLCEGVDWTLMYGRRETRHRMTRDAEQAIFEQTGEVVHLPTHAIQALRTEINISF